MSAKDESDGNRESKRKQKNLRLHERYHDQLEELAVEWFGSEQKQGQVVEKLLDLHGDDDVVGMIEEMHSVIVEGQSAHTQASPESSDDKSESESVVAELERRAAEGEPIDPEEFDLSVIKGGRDVNRGEILAQAILTTHTGLDNDSIQQFIRNEADYSPNAARDRRKEVQDVLGDELHDPIPGSDWVKEQVKQDLRDERHKAREGGEGMTETKYRRTYAGGPADYAGCKNPLPGDGPYASEQVAADAVKEAFDELLRAYDSGGKHQKRRAWSVIEAVFDEVEGTEVMDAVPSGSEESLADIVLYHDVLEDLFARSDSDA